MTYTYGFSPGFILNSLAFFIQRLEFPICHASEPTNQVVPHGKGRKESTYLNQPLLCAELQDEGLCSVVLICALTILLYAKLNPHLCECSICISSLLAIIIGKLDWVKFGGGRFVHKNTGWIQPKACPITKIIWHAIKENETRRT
jgi:hypothetical protein